MENRNQENENLERMLETQFCLRDHDPEFTIAYANECGIYGICISVEDFSVTDRTERSYA
jgi:hypothetical protein